VGRSERERTGGIGRHGWGMVGSVKTEREGQKAGGTEGGRNRQGREVNTLLDGELEAGRVSEKRKECLNMQTMWDAHDFKHTIKHKLNLEGSKIQREGERTHVDGEFAVPVPVCRRAGQFSELAR
jgi:hypothetical protein